MIRSSDNSAENGIKKVIFIFLAILSIHIWELRYIPQLIKSENLLVWMICIFSFFLVMGRSNMKFKYAILLFLTGLVLNTMAAYMNLGQSPVKTILAFEYSYFILIYFLLHYLNLSRKFLENTIIAFAIIYCSGSQKQYHVIAAFGQRILLFLIAFPVGCIILKKFRAEVLKFHWNDIEQLG